MNLMNLRIWWTSLKGSFPHVFCEVVFPRGNAPKTSSAKIGVYIFALVEYCDGEVLQVGFFFGGVRMAYLANG